MSANKGLASKVLAYKTINMHINITGRLIKVNMFTALTRLQNEINKIFKNNNDSPSHTHKFDACERDGKVSWWVYYK